ncbi:MAG TPA: GAF domain-containing protein [Candidatus Bathyarchaeia archaeon]|nr:GAF domain-containing protein [Candidatus Bathyarchaeia archaeon]
MYTIDFPCTACKRVLKVSTEHIGKSGTCNHCGGRIVIRPVPYRNMEGDDEAGALEALAENIHCLEELIDGVYGFLAKFLDCDFQNKAVLFLMNEQADGLRLTKTRGKFSREFLRDEAFVPLGKCLCGRAAQSGQVLVCENCFADPRHDNVWVGMQTHGHYVIPLTHAGNVLGVLTLYTRTGVQTDGSRMALLAKVGEHAGNGLQRLLQMEKQTSSS